MPFSGISDPSIPDRVKTFWKNIRATNTDKRQWVNVFNSCFRSPPSGTSQSEKDGVCIRVASGVMGRTIRRRRGEMSEVEMRLDDTAIDFQIVAPENLPEKVTKDPLQDCIASKIATGMPEEQARHECLEEQSKLAGFECELCEYFHGKHESLTQEDVDTILEIFANQSPSKSVKNPSDYVEGELDDGTKE